MIDDLETKKRFASAMSAMYKAFNKEPDKDITKILFLTLQQLTIEDAEQCISQAILTCERFPTPVELKRCISLIPRRELPQIENKPFGHRDEQLAIDSGKLVNGYLSGKLSRENLIEGMQVMDRQYPGLGWSTEAAKLAGHFRSTEELKNSPLTGEVRL